MSWPSRSSGPYVTRGRDARWNFESTLRFPLGGQCGAGAIVHHKLTIRQFAVIAEIGIVLMGCEMEPVAFCVALDQLDIAPGKVDRARDHITLLPDVKIGRDAGAV